MTARRSLLSVLACVALARSAAAQKPGDWTRADTLRGSHTAPERTWWDVTFYDLQVRVTPRDSSIRGSNRISYRVLAPGTALQVDLKTPLEVDSMVQDRHAVPFRRDGDAFFATLPKAPNVGEVKALAVFYHGQPQPAKRPPWDGGFSWGTDSLGRPWVVTTDQGIGASIWWPNKDTQADEPDSQRVAINVPTPMVNVSNGRLRGTTKLKDGTTTYEWFVTNPINNYAIAVAAGSYAHWSETYDGEAGKLTLDFWPLDYHLDAAKRQWVQARTTLKCFEHWFGPYPWYEDGYKLIEVSNNGMEHQSAVSYGNGFANGYRGRDASKTGLGLEWDFIIVHESAHEWWGNNITTQDLADMWVHESFANYAEGLYTECLFGKEAGARYMVGNRSWIRNDRPIVPAAYGVNAEGSGDMYPKGGQMLHTIRQIVNDDAKWREILRGLNAAFRHRIVTGAQVQDYIGAHAATDLRKVFQQYLTTTQVPALEYRLAGDSLAYRWADVVPGFDMPVEVATGDGPWVRLYPTEMWQATTLPGVTPATFKVNPDFYVTTRPVTE